MIILIGSIALGRADLNSDIDCFVSLEEARELNSINPELWTLAGGVCDAYYIETIEAGYDWAPAISDPTRDNPMKPREQMIWIEPQTFSGARILTKEQLLKIVDELKADEIPMTRGLTWAPKDRSALNIRARRDEEMFMFSKSGLSQRKIAAIYKINQSNVQRAIHRARIKLMQQAS